jgi:hypothetical protein
MDFVNVICVLVLGNDGVDYLWGFFSKEVPSLIAKVAGV